MSDFLNFLNTADLDTLIKISGITRPIGENIIAARSFDFVEDCLKVRGVGKNMLSRMMSNYEAGGNASESRAMIQVEEEAMPALIERSRPAQESVEEKPSFLSRLGQAFINFLRDGCFWKMMPYNVSLTITEGFGKLLVNKSEITLRIDPNEKIGLRIDQRI